MPTDPQPEASFTPHPDVQVRVLDGEAVLLNVRSGSYFGLNKVGTHIWELFGQGKTVTAVVAGVCRRFEVEPDQAEEDVRAFTDSLVERGLLQAP